MKRYNPLSRTLFIATLCLGSLAGSNIVLTSGVAQANSNPKVNKPSMVLTEENNGKTVTTRVGDIIEVLLVSNATTGYEWSIITQNKYALSSVGAPRFIAPESDMPGAPGHQSFLFRANKAGDTQLKLGYARPFEAGKPPIQTFDVKIKIQ